MFKKLITIWQVIMTTAFVGALVFGVLVSDTAKAQIGTLINFSGKVTNTDGSELTDGTYDFTFGLYDSPTGGSSLWTESLTVANRFSGIISSTTLLANGRRYEYTGGTATSTLRIGQYITNASTSASVLLVDYNTASSTITVATTSPVWSIGQPINNRPYVEGGIININLGSVTDMSSVDFSQARYLEIVFNGETMQPRKLLVEAPRAVDSIQLGGKTESEYASLAEDETIAGEWSFNNIVDISSSSAQTALTVTQNGSGNLVEFKSGASTFFAVLNDGRIQIGDYYLPADTTGGSAGHVLKLGADDNMYWAPDFASGFGVDGKTLWATSSDDLMIYPINTSYVTVIGSNSTSTLENQIFEVDGSSLFDIVNISEQQQLRFYDADSSNYTGVRASGTITSNFVLTLPATAGTDGLALVTDGNGNLSWASPTSFVYVNSGTEGQIPYFAADGSVLTGTSDIFVNASGGFGVGTTTFSTLFAVGGTSGNQFLINSDGEVVGGIWLGDTIGVDYGGTGTTTFEQYSLLYAPLDNIIGEILAGTNGQVLKMVGGVPTWSATSSGGTHSLLSADHLDTIVQSAVSGGLMFATTSNAWDQLAIGNQGDILMVTGNNLPGWAGTSSLGFDNFSSWRLEADNASTSISSAEMFTLTGSTALQTSLTGNTITISPSGNYNIPLTASTSNWNTAYGWGNHANAGYYSTSTTMLVDWGGTGQTSWTQYAIPYLTDTDTFGEIEIGTSTYVLAVNASGNGYDWVEASSTGVVLSQEQVDSYVDALINDPDSVHTRLTIIYDDADNAMDFVVNPDLSLYSNATSSFWATSTGAMPVKYGGIGTTTFEQYSLLYAPSDNTISEILAGVEGQVLKIVGGIPMWSATSSGGAHSLLSADHSDAIAQSAVSGGLMFATTSNAWDQLAIGNPGDILMVTGNNLPAWRATSTLTTIDIQEGSNLYYTNVRAQAAISVTATGLTYSSGAIGLDTPTYIIPLTASTTNWNTAYNTVTASSTNWDLAFGWGDHAEAGYYSTSTTLTVDYGGTGTTTFEQYSLLYASQNNTISEILAGIEGQVLKMVGGKPVWSATSSSGDHSLLSVAHSDVDATSTLVRGDLLVVNSDTEWSRLALGVSGYILYSNGTDSYWSTTTAITALGTITMGTWEADVIDVAYGGTGSSTVAGARESLDLDEIYQYGINTATTAGMVWISDGDGNRGRWVATSSLGISGGASSGGDISLFVGTTTATTDGSIATGTLTGYVAANNMCHFEYPGSHFCRTYDILVTVEQGDISVWGGSAWVAEGPPGFISNSNDCNGWESAATDFLGAYWKLNSTTGGSGVLTVCTSEKPLACCSRQ